MEEEQKTEDYQQKDYSIQLSFNLRCEIQGN